MVGLRDARLDIRLQIDTNIATKEKRFPARRLNILTMRIRYMGLNYSCKMVSSFYHNVCYIFIKVLSVYLFRFVCSLMSAEFRNYVLQNMICI